jgi:hypothetical protein
MDAKLWSILPYRVKKLSARAAGGARAGRDARVRVELAADGGRPGRHVVRCDVYDPRGKWCSHYSKNLVVERGRGELGLPLAESDPPGSWRIAMRDCVSGRRAESRLRVSAAGRRRR